MAGTWASWRKALGNLFGCSQRRSERRASIAGVVRPIARSSPSFSFRFYSLLSVTDLHRLYTTPWQITANLISRNIPRHVCRNNSRSFSPSFSLPTDTAVRCLSAYIKCTPTAARSIPKSVSTPALPPSSPSLAAALRYPFRRTRPLPFPSATVAPQRPHLCPSSLPLRPRPTLPPLLFKYLMFLVPLTSAIGVRTLSAPLALYLMIPYASARTMFWRCMTFLLNIKTITASPFVLVRSYASGTETAVDGGTESSRGAEGGFPVIMLVLMSIP